MENHNFSWENPLLMVIFNSYVKLPEGNPQVTMDFNTKSWSNDLDDDWGTPILGHLQMMYIQFSGPKKA